MLHGREIYFRISPYVKCDDLATLSLCNKNLQSAFLAAKRCYVDCANSHRSFVKNELLIRGYLPFSASSRENKLMKERTRGSRGDYCRILAEKIDIFWIHTRFKFPFRLADGKTLVNHNESEWKLTQKHELCANLYKWGITGLLRCNNIIINQVTTKMVKKPLSKREVHTLF